MYRPVLKWLLIAVPVSIVLTALVYLMGGWFGAPAGTYGFRAIVVPPALTASVISLKNRAAGWLSLLATLPLGFGMVFWMACAVSGQCL